MNLLLNRKSEAEAGLEEQNRGGKGQEDEVRNLSKSQTKSQEVNQCLPQEVFFVFFFF